MTFGTLELFYSSPQVKLLNDLLAFGKYAKQAFFQWGQSPFSWCFWEIQGIPGQFSNVPVLSPEFCNQHMQKLSTSFLDSFSPALHIHILLTLSTVLQVPSLFSMTSATTLVLILITSVLDSGVSLPTQVCSPSMVDITTGHTAAMVPCTWCLVAVRCGHTTFPGQWNLSWDMGRSEQCLLLSVSYDGASVMSPWTVESVPVGPSGGRGGVQPLPVWCGHGQGGEINHLSHWNLSLLGSYDIRLNLMHSVSFSSNCLCTPFWGNLKYRPDYSLIGGHQQFTIIYKYKIQVSGFQETVNSVLNLLFQHSHHTHVLAPREDSLLPTNVHILTWDVTFVWGAFALVTSCWNPTIVYAEIQMVRLSWISEVDKYCLSSEIPLASCISSIVFICT